MEPLRRGPSPWLAALLALVILCCCGAMTAAFFVTRATRGTFLSLGGQVEATQRVVRSLDTTGTVTLVVQAPVGAVMVRAAGGARVTVNAVKQAWSNSQAQAQAALDRIDVQVAQEGNSVRVTVAGIDPVQDIVRSPRVDLEITVPLETAVSVTLNVGNVTVSGTRGDVTIVAGAGNVTLDGVLPGDSLQVQARVANITLRGALAPRAEYVITSDVGRISAELPAGSSFRVDARSDVGNVHLYGFRLAGSNQRQGVVGQTASGDVGAAPRFSLALRTRIGDIAIRAVN